MLKISFILLMLTPVLSFAQSEDEQMIRAIFDEALYNGQSYEMLRYLSKDIGPRLSGSPQAAAAVEWTRQEMERLNFDNVFLQEVMVPHWVRGVESARIIDTKAYGSRELSVCALGNSVGTPAGGITAPVVEVKDFEQLRELGRENVEGKIVFFNRPMDAGLINTFSAYGGAVNQRGSGASEAARYGAAGVIVRSMASNIDDFPHTGSLRYQEGVAKLPALAVSTKDAEILSDYLAANSDLLLHMESGARILPDVLSHNVVGELKGRRSGYIAVGGHLDSWDKGDGAHDDGAGCVQSIEALRILKSIGYQPRYTLRAVMFMNEENGLRGGRKYADLSLENKEDHIAAIESDRGAFVPRGFTSTLEEKEKILRWKELLEPYGLGDLERNGGGADIGPLAEQEVPLFGLYPDPQRYFNVHHSDADVFEAVDKRELEMGAAAMAALIYLIDKYGLE